MEIARVLKPGGAQIFTVPLALKCDPSRRRAVLLPEGQIEHILSSEYQGNPVDGSSSLVAMDWGFGTISKTAETSGLVGHFIAIDDIDRGIRANFVEVIVSFS